MARKKILSQLSSRRNGGYKSMDYKKLLGRNLCLQLLAERMGDPNRTRFVQNSVSALLENPRRRDLCWVAKTGVDTSSGYVSFKYLTKRQINLGKISGRRTMFRMHSVAFVAVHGRMPVHVASHLCGEKRCFNPVHILDESQQKNVERSHCFGSVVCPVHRHVILDLCRCQPKCISQVHPPSRLNCCRSAAEENATDLPESVSVDASIESSTSENNGSDNEEAPHLRLALRKLGQIAREVGSATGQKRRKFFSSPPPSTSALSSAGSLVDSDKDKEDS